MEELTNQSADIEETGLDLWEEEPTPEESEAEPETSEEAEETEETPDTFELGIRYNGQDMKLSRDEATTLAQKGMNYDKMYQRLQELQNDPIRQKFDRLASEAGMTTEEYANRMELFLEQSNIQRIAREFKDQNPDISDDVATKYAEKAYAAQKAQTERQRADTIRQQKQTEDNALLQEVQSFSERYPDVDIKTLPDEVIDDINSGTPLETAWLRHQNREFLKRITNNETNAKNKAKSTGSVSDNQGGSGGGDDFIKGLLG